MVKQIVINQNGIRLTEEDSFRAILASELAYSVDNPEFGSTPLHRLRENIKQTAIQYPFFESRLLRLSVIEINTDCVFLRDPSRFTAYCLIRGTDLVNSGISDLYNDLEIAMGRNTSRTSRINSIFKKIRKKEPNVSWEFIGHSLGAEVALELGILYNDIYVTAFEPGRSSLNPKNQCHKIYTNIREHRILHDPLTSDGGPAYVCYVHDIEKEKHGFISDISSFHIMANYTNTIYDSYPASKLEGDWVLVSKDDIL